MDGLCASAKLLSCMLHELHDLFQQLLGQTQTPSLAYHSWILIHESHVLHLLHRHWLHSCTGRISLAHARQQVQFP